MSISTAGMLMKWRDSGEMTDLCLGVRIAQAITAKTSARQQKRESKPVDHCSGVSMCKARLEGAPFIETQDGGARYFSGASRGS
jgi:hypothetical protein